MISSTAEYQAAIVGSPRRIEVLAVVDISDPDLEFGETLMDSSAPWSKPEEFHDKVFDAPARYFTLEPGRCILDGKSKIFPDDYNVSDNVGIANNTLSGPDGSFPQGSPAFIQQMIENVDVLQAVSIFFSSDPVDGVPSDFAVDVMVGDVSFYTKEFVGNTDSQVSIEGFTVYNPDSIKLTITKWSLPQSRVRAVDIITGVYEQWTGRMLASFNCNMQGDFSCLSLPYGTLTISMDNKSRRFEPRRKDGVFQSIEARQGIDVYIGVRLANGAVERKKVGVYYQAGDGWRTGNNSVTMSWSLVDIVGLVANRTYIVPDTLPTTLDGWLASIVAQLGDSFKNRYHVDPDYASKPVTARDKESVTSKKCGDILRWACMATGTWPRADQETGYLTAEPLWNQGNKITLGNLVNYPTLSANKSLAAIIFTLADGNSTQYIVSGNSTSSEDTVSVSNPFIHTQEEALTAARLILSCYGGNMVELVGRGDPSSEIGDVDTVWLDESTATTARRQTQSFSITNGVLQNCQSKLLQADGSYMFQEYAIITESGKWKVPANIKGDEVRAILAGGGQGAGKGMPGSMGTAQSDYSIGTPGHNGADGQNGAGGKVWAGTIKVNPEQEIDVHIGRGGAAADVSGVPGELGEATTFGAYSSDNGHEYPIGYSDIASGSSFGRTGVKKPAPNTGDGAAGGPGGFGGMKVFAGTIPVYNDKGEQIGFEVIYTTVSKPTDGEKGEDGASGVALIYWDKEGT